MSDANGVGPIESALRAKRESGRKCLVPYITGGFGDEWLRAIEAAAQAGADAIEIGLPFSDPVMDGPTIQEASELALRAGATPTNILDLPLEETLPWREVADGLGVETILLAAPTGSDERLVEVTNHAKGFVYGVGLLGITGERAKLAASATEMARRLKAVTDKPVLVGVGVSTPEQAVEVCEHADGVIVGSAIVRRLLEGQGAEGVGALVSDFRSALDSAWGEAN